MDGKCDVCLIDLHERPAERLAVNVIYPHPAYGPTPMALDLCPEHLAMAHDPANEIVVLS